MEQHIGSESLAEYRVASTDLLCPSQCCTSGFEEVPIFLVQTGDLTQDPAMMVQSTCKSSFSPNEQSTVIVSVSANARSGSDTTNWLPLYGINDETRISSRPADRSEMARKMPRSAKTGPVKTHLCHCDQWGNWRNMFLVLLILCSVIFIVTDLYHLTHLELLAFGLRGSSSANLTTNYLVLPDIHHGSYQWGAVRSAVQYIEHQRHKPFHRELWLRPMSDEMMVCARRWQMEWLNGGAGINQPHGKSTLPNVPQIIVGNVQSRSIFREHHTSLKPVIQKKVIRKKGENVMFEMRYSPGIKVFVEISELRLLPEYHDVSHMHSDNGIVLDTSRRSNMRHWRAPLQALLESKCRHPLPKHYYLTMHPYLDRHTTARRRICVLGGSPGTGVMQSKSHLCPPGLPTGSVYYERSINGQCTQNLISATLITDKASFLPPQRNSFYCTTNSAMVTDLFNEHITERQSYLKDAHCDTQRRLCQTCLRRSCWADRQRQPVGTELIEDLTQSWDWMRDEVVNRTEDLNHKCCGVSCYSNPSCQEYYSPSCQRFTINQPEMEEVCLQGQTLKFTLNPEFDLNNGSYLCHVRYNPPDQLYSIRLWLAIGNYWQTESMQVSVSTSEISGLANNAARNPFSAQSRKPGHVARRTRDHAQRMIARHGHGRVRLLTGAVQIEHRSKLPIWTEAIVNQEAAGPNELMLYRLKSFDEFNLSKPELQKHRDEKYIVLQFTRPFLHNTESWGNQSCQLNISHLHLSQPIYVPNDGLAIALANPIGKTSTGAFEYVVDDRKSPSAQIQVMTNPESTRSILYSAFCLHGMQLKLAKSENSHSANQREPGSLLYQPGRKPQVTAERIHLLFNPVTCTEEQTWRVTVTGWVTSKPAYLKLDIYQNFIVSPAADHRIPIHQSLLRSEDLLLLPSENSVPSSTSTTVGRDAAATAAYTSFTFSFDARVTTLPGHIVLETSATPSIRIELNDCSQRYTLYSVLTEYKDSGYGNYTALSKVSTTQSGTQNLSQIRWTMDRLYLPFVVICTTIGSLYLILLIIYGIVRLYASSNSARSLNPTLRVGPPSHTGRVGSSGSKINIKNNNNDNNNRSTNIQRTRCITDQHMRRPHSTSLCSATSLLSTPVHDVLHSPPHRMSTARKLMVMAYLCFRVFYTFLFTISVAVSFVLSIESNAAREFSAAIHSTYAARLAGPKTMNVYVISPMDLENRWRGAKSWMFEAARMEDFSQSELLRQFQSLNNQLTKCAEANRLTSAQLAHRIQLASEQYKEWLDPRRDRISLLDRSTAAETVASGPEPLVPGANQTWSTTPTDMQHTTIDRTTWNLIENANWLPYLDTVDEYLRKVRDDLDSRVIDRWAPFDRLLANLLSNTWIAPARRALNSSWLQVQNTGLPIGSEAAANLATDDNYYYHYEDRADQATSNQNANGGRSKESRALKLANFLGVPQPTHARLTGARIWNSFRNLVPGLPSRFYFDLSTQLLNGQGKPPASSLSHWHATRYLDQRYMLSNEDWKHVAGGYLGENPNKAYRYLQNLDMQSLPRLQMTPNVPNALPSNSYFLNLTQARLILLLLDAIIILARCYQTFRFMQNVWFGSVKRIRVERVSRAPGQSNSITEESASGFSERGVYSDSADFMHPATCSTQPGNDGTLQIATSNTESAHSQPISLQIGPSSGTLEMKYLGRHKPGSTPVPHALRPTEFRSQMDGAGTGRLTACYCCLDAHYLLIIVGVGLLLVGLALLWAADRHVRPGWLLAKTGVYARSKALEDCRMRTNAILKTIQPAHLNRNVMRTLRKAVQAEASRLERLHMRFEHEKVQIARQYFSELCTLERSPLAMNPNFAEQGPENLWKLTTPSACALFNSKREFTRLITQILANRATDLHGSQAATSGRNGIPAEPFVCLLTPIVPATYTEGHASRMIRLAQSISKLKHRVNRTHSGGAYSTTTWPKNQSGLELFSADERLLDLDQLSLSMGSLSALTNALHRLLLTSLSVIWAMGGLLACLHLAKLVAKRACPLRIGKVNWITSYPPQTLFASEQIRS